MKRKGFISSLIALLILCTLLAACGPTKDELVGTWTSEWIYNGKSIESIIYLYKSGDYLNIDRIDGESEWEAGTL